MGMSDEVEKERECEAADEALEGGGSPYSSTDTERNARLTWVIRPDL